MRCGLNKRPALVAALIAAGLSCCAVAQPYPQRPVRVVVPFPPGAGSDFVMRLFAPRMGELLGQPLVIDNRSGAAGNLGASMVARATPDGHTLLTVSVSHAIAHGLQRQLEYHLTRDFRAVGLLASTPYILAVHPALAVTGLGELIALAKSRPGRLTYASSGVGGGTHLAMELLASRAGISMLHVPYKGTAPAIAELLGGQVSLMFASQLMPQVQAGRVRAIAISSPTRSAVAPELLTVAEQGFPGFEAGSWFGVFAPAGTPDRAIASLNAAITAVGRVADIRQRLLVQSSAEVLGGSPAEMQRFVALEITKWQKIAVSAGIRAE